MLKEPGSPFFTAGANDSISLKRIIQSKASLKMLYTNYYKLLLKKKAHIPGYPTVELGAGCGFIKELDSNILTIDILDSPGIDLRADACQLPFADKSIGNFVFLNMLHHIPRPYEFLEGISTYLVNGGRLVFVEPYISVVSHCLYRFLHAEKENFSMELRREWDFHDPFRDANTAIPTLMFCNNLNLTKKELSMWNVNVKEIIFHNIITHAISGGYTYRSLLPAPVLALVLKIENLLPTFILKNAAMLLSVTLEKKESY
ncbi:methyltransferase domain-containing protein [Candidatus Parcubacteria bacterium]|nr:MAG: methyltransferase domain-containing protein [Candidatus Parcubacteria bacterium]